MNFATSKRNVVSKFVLKEKKEFSYKRDVLGLHYVYQKSRKNL